MLYFFGNCQSDFLSRMLVERGYDCSYRVLASPMTYPSHPGSIPASLAHMEAKIGLGDYFHGRELKHQFQLIAPGDAAPELIVMNLHHENTPLFVHDTEKYVFFMDPRALTDNPEMMQWTQDHCRMFQPNPATYLKRFHTMLTRVREVFPAVPIVVLSRLSPFPAFGPEPFSYLKGWTTLHQGATAQLSAWAKEMHAVHVIDMDRIFGGIWAESDKRIESQCPFLKITLEENDGAVVGLHARRDIEHIGSMPGRLAEKIIQFMQTGAIEYDETEIAAPEWRGRCRLRTLSDNELLKKLCSGANYQSAEAVGSFFLDLNRDHTDLLVQARDYMPVCHMTLHMIKAYSRIWRNPAFADWCDAHLLTAKRFTANGRLYQEAYIDRVEGMRRFVSE